jgi:hypothetical protein
MSKKWLSAVVVCLLLAAVSITNAQQQAPSGPPRVLQISHEEIKPDKGPAHEQQAKHYVQLLAKANSPYYRLALLPVTGEENEVLYLWGFDSYAQAEKFGKDSEKWATETLKADFDQLQRESEGLHASVRNLLASHREDLSFHPTHESVSQARYFQTVTFRVRPGHEADFAEAVKIVRAAYEKLNVEVHWLTYQVSSGAPSPTFLVFIPRKSFEELDEGLARSKAFQEAEGQENVKRLERIAAEAYVNVESGLYRLAPKISYVSKEFAASNPDFWTPKAEAVESASTAKKQLKRPAPKP